MSETIEGEVVSAEAPAFDQTTALAKFNALEAVQREVLERLNAPHDLSTLALIAAARKDVAFSVDYRVSVEKTHKVVKAPLLELGRQADALKKSMIDAVRDAEDKLRTAIEAEEKKREEAAAERKRQEAERIAEIDKKIDAIDDLAYKAQRKTAEQVNSMLGDLKLAQPTEAEFEALFQKATLTWTRTVERLEVIHAEKIAQEAEQARLKAEREALEQQKREQEARAAELQRQEQAQAEANRIEQERLARERAEFEKQQATAPRPVVESSLPVQGTAHEALPQGAGQGEGGALNRHESGRAEEMPPATSIEATASVVEQGRSPVLEAAVARGELRRHRIDIDGARMRDLAGTFIAVINDLQDGPHPATIDEVIMSMAHTLGSVIAQRGIILDLDAPLSIALPALVRGYQDACAERAQ